MTQNEEYLPPGVVSLGSGMYAAPFRDREADIAIAKSFGEYQIRRDICDGQRGYLVTHPSGSKCFHFRLGSALREIMRGLGHGEDRDLMVIGEPDVLNAW